MLFFSEAYKFLFITLFHGNYKFYSSHSYFLIHSKSDYGVLKNKNVSCVLISLLDITTSLCFAGINTGCYYGIGTLLNPIILYYFPVSII